MDRGSGRCGDGGDILREIRREKWVLVI
jgi:hypothetical protein